MSKTNSLETRMKEKYENRSKTYLLRGVPAFLRLDGCHFHSYTKGFKRPYDEYFHQAMNATMKHLCENIQGCKLGYTQSDEITLLLTDYDTPTTEAWFGYSVRKMCSVAASMATLVFNREFERATRDFRCRVNNCLTCTEEESRLAAAFEKAIAEGALFDCRPFSVPEDEVTNAIIWRQKDCTRNAIQMLGQTHFNHGELKGKSNNEVQDMLMLQKGINFNDMPVAFKRGVCCIKTDVEVGNTTRKRWCIDTNIPIFTQDREYIERCFRRPTE